MKNEKIQRMKAKELPEENSPKGSQICFILNTNTEYR